MKSAKMISNSSESSEDNSCLKKLWEKNFGEMTGGRVEIRILSGAQPLGESDKGVNK